MKRPASFVSFASLLLLSLAACGGSDDGAGDAAGAGGGASSTGAGAGAGASGAASGQAGTASGQAGSAAGQAGTSAGTGPAGKGGSQPAGSGGTGTAGTGGMLACDGTLADCNANPADGCEVDLSSDPAHCGTCAKKCPAGKQGLPLCEAGQCTFFCLNGYEDCNGVAADGCEHLVTNDVTNCGACGKVCPTPAHGTADCVDGKCGVACQTGFGDCDGDPATGCEVDTQTTPKHCGACGVDCSNGTCSAGACSCTGTVVPAAHLSFSVFFLVERSSKSEASGEWDETKAAILAYVADPANAGVEVALGAIPAAVGCVDDVPPVVPFGTLPGNAAAVTSALAALPSSGASVLTQPALLSAVGEARARTKAGRAGVVALLSRTFPTGCATFAAQFSSLGASASANVDPVAIAVDSKANGMPQGFASAPKFVPSLTLSSPAGFATSMAEVSTFVTKCSFVLPPGNTGLLNVLVTPAGSTPTTLKEGICNDGADWGVTAGATPHVQTCSCPDATTAVELQLGCPTAHFVK